MSAAKILSCLCLMFLMVHPTLAATNDGKSKDAITGPIGSVSEEIKTIRDPEWSYYVYLPNAFDPAKEWPVLFVMSPDGGEPHMLDRYKAGAEAVGWILVLSVQSRNGFEKSGEAVEAMVKDVSNRLPVDRSHFYASGFSGGARRAFEIVGNKRYQKHFAGIIPTGAGCYDKLSAKTTPYVLCGAGCQNSFEMVNSFDNLSNGSNSRLRVFPAGHEWPSEDLFLEAMLWLEGVSLKLEMRSGDSFNTRKARYVANILQLVEDNGLKTDPVKLAEFIKLASGIKVPPELSKKVMVKVRELQQQPETLSYAKGLTALNRFLDKYVTQEGNAAKTQNPKAAKREAEKRMEEYKDTELADIFRILVANID